MPCERPGISPIDEGCCFSCTVVGRGSYQAPIAIVLHEVDEHIEALNNRMENCCDTAHDECHQSFHYGVGDGGLIMNFVDPDDTAWSFSPLNTDPVCGICGWSIATQEGTGVDPNLYTINIAVSTGISSFSHHGRGSNHYTEDQYDAIVRLTGWLAETYGIVVNQNNIWRHCDELDDFPEACPNGNTYSDFLIDVQACIDASPLGPIVLCEQLEEIVDVGPATPDDCEGVGGTVLLGTDCSGYTIPYIFDPCALVPVAYDPAAALKMMQDDGICCQITLVPVSDCTAAPVVSAIGLDINGLFTFAPLSSDGMMTDRVVAVSDVTVETDRLVFVDATDGNVILTLADPTGWCHNQIRVKRIDTTGGNTVTVASAANIDASASILLATPGPFSAGAGEAVHLEWNGATWFII